MEYKIIQSTITRHSTETDKDAFLKLLANNFIEYGYVLLSKKYINNNSLLEIMDQHGYVFTQSLRNIRQHGFIKNYRMSAGMRKSKQEHLADIKKIAMSRGGDLLSDNFVNSSTKLNFVDCAGNNFIARPSTIIRGQWTPYDGKITENICRQVFEYIFDTDFPSTWDVIIRENKKSLQLDGYNEKVVIGDKTYKIAFEYQGWESHQNDKDCIERDQYKKDFCEKNGINLIVIEKFDNIAKNDMWYLHRIKNNISQIVPELEKHLDEKTIFKIDYSKINQCNLKFEYWSSYGLSLGYELLESRYVNNSTKMKWKRISDSYQFLRSAAVIKMIGFPPENNKMSKSLLQTNYDHLEDLRLMAIRRGGKLISTTWNGAMEKYTFVDVCGNIFNMSGGNAKNGQWSIYETTKGGAKIKKLLCGDIEIKTITGDIIICGNDNIGKFIKEFNGIEIDGKSSS